MVLTEALQRVVLLMLVLLMLVVVLSPLVHTSLTEDASQ